MTTNEAISQPTRKLSVVDTLDHARRALSTHRQWLQRQDSSDYFGGRIEDGSATEDKDSEWMVDDMEDEEVLQKVRVKPPLAGSAPPVRAPPTSLPATTHTASQWIEFLKQRKVSAKVSPAPILVEEKERDVEVPAAARERVSWAQGSTCKRDENTNSSEELPREQPKPKRPKMKWVSKATVSPAISGQNDVTSSVPLHLFTSPTSTSTDVPPLANSPLLANPPISDALTAWGSLSSLDKYMESLETGNHDQKQSTKTSFPKVALTSLNVLSGDESSTSEQEKDSAHAAEISVHTSTSNYCLQHMTTEDGASNSPQSVPVEELVQNQNSLHPPTRNHPLQQDDRTSHLGELHHDNQAVAAEPPKEMDVDAIDVVALQSESSATILPVEPAPNDRQSSYEAHQHSKLEQMGRGLRVIEVKERSPTQLESGSVKIMPAENISVSKSLATSEALIEGVLPYQTRESETANVALRPADPDSKPLLPAGPINREPTLSPPSSTHLQTVDMVESCETIKDNSDITTSALVSASNTLETSNQNGGRGDSQPEGDLSFHPRLTSTPSAPPEGETKVEGSRERRRQILGELQLPPLKDNIRIGGARSILSRLPRLKSQTPTSPTNTGISTELKMSRKRSQELPSYVTHHYTTAGLALNPPCPGYGVKQPEDSLQRKCVYSTPSFPKSSPPSSPLNNNRMPLKSVTKQVTTSSTRTPPLELSPFPVRKTTPQGSPVQQQQKRHAGLRHTMSSPAKSANSAGHDIEGGVGEGRRESVALDSPLLKSQKSWDTGSLDASGLRGSTSSLYHMHTGPGPLHLAAKSGNLRQLQLLISEGGKVNIRDHEGRTPLMYCLHSRGVHLSCASLLIQEGAGLDKQASDGSTAIHLASAVGAISLIEFSIMNHADPDIRDFEGRLPLHWATLSMHSSKCAALLLKHSRLDINAVDDTGMTPLMWAAYNNNPVVTAFLLNQGAECEEKDMDGMTAMHWAVHQVGIKCLDLLLKTDHTYFKDHRGRTVFHCAAEVGSVAACELVLTMRADAVHDLDRMGRTPLHYAAACSRVDVCALLLDCGSDASQRDLTGRTAIEYAREKKLDYVVALLTCHGTAVADFARASWSSSVASLLNRATSFSQLPISKETPDIITESLQLLPSKSAQTRDEGSDSEINPSIPYDGAFLGRFVQDKNDPLQHFFFWLTKQSPWLHWSRERDRRRPQQAMVYEVHTGPSELLRKNPVYSPEELHQHVFWVMTDCGVFDMLAYNEDSYQVWVNGIGTIAQGKPKTEGSVAEEISPGESKAMQIGPQRKISLQSQPKKTFRLKTKRSASVVPALVLENGTSDSTVVTTWRSCSKNSQTHCGQNSDSEVDLRSRGHSASPTKLTSTGTNAALREQRPLQEDTFIDHII